MPRALCGQDSRFSQVFLDRPGKLKAQIRRCSDNKKPAATFAGAGDTRFSGIYKAPASSQIGAETIITHSRHFLQTTNLAPGESFLM